MIKLKIDYDKITESRLFVGKKGRYLDAILIPTPDNSYGNDYMIVESVTIEEKEKGVKGAILGNAKIITKAQPPTGVDADEIVDKDGLPF